MFKNKGYCAVQLFFILMCAWDALWNTRLFKIKEKAFFSIISISSYAILDHNVACLKLQILQIMGFLSSLLRGKLDIELLSPVNVNGSCMPNSFRSPEQMYAYESALLGFLGLYPLKVSLVWIIANPPAYSQPSPGYCSWTLWNFSSHNQLELPSNLKVPICYPLCLFRIKLKLPNCSIFIYLPYIFILQG